MDIVATVAALISEHTDQVGRYFAAVACVERHGRWLLGRSTARDDRRGLWCFPGGGIDDGESPERAAVRECWEEAAVRCKSIGRAIDLSSKPGVAFVICKGLGDNQPVHNHEFSDMGFFSFREMKRMSLYPNVEELVRRL